MEDIEIRATRYLARRQKSLSEEEDCRDAIKSLLIWSCDCFLPHYMKPCLIQLCSVKASDEMAPEDDIKAREDYICFLCMSDSAAVFILKCYFELHLSGQCCSHSSTESVISCNVYGE